MLIDKEYNWQGKIVLIAEDEEINYMFVERVLKPTGATIIRALDGKEAVDIVASRSDIDLILMDIRMPNLNGIEAAEAIRKTRPNILIIAQTCYETDIDLSSITTVKFDGFISKPVNVNTMLTMIDRLLNK